MFIFINSIYSNNDVFKMVWHDRYYLNLTIINQNLKFNSKKI